MLQQALDVALAADLDVLSAGELLDVACEVQTLATRVTALRSKVLAAADTATDAPASRRELGFRTTTQVVAARTGAPAFDIRTATAMGRWLLDFPIFADAAAQGVLTQRHLKEVKALDKPHRRESLVASQARLVAAARANDFVGFTNRLTVWLINHTTAEEVAEQAKKTSCSWNKNTDGSIDGRFHLDPLSAAAVGNALGDEMQRLFRQQNNHDGTSATANRRRGQALVGLIIGGAEAPESATTTPLVNLVIGQTILANLLERFVDPDTPAVPVDYDNPDLRCQTIDGTPIHPDIAFAAVAVAEFERIVLDAESRPIDVSVKSRGFPAWMKRALLVAAQGRCKIRGCDACHYWLQVDHEHPFSKGGETRLDNGQILCDPDNKWKADLVA